MKNRGLIFTALALLAAFPSLRARWTWEKENVVTLCVDGAEVDALFPGADLAPFFTAGVRSVSVVWDGSEPLAGLLDRWSARLPSGMTLTLRPFARDFSGMGNPLPWGELAAAAGRVRYLLPGGTALPPPEPDSPLQKVMAASPWVFPWVEFTRVPAFYGLARSFPERTVRAHAVEEEEILRLSPAAVVLRLRRAVRERGVRFLYVRLFPDRSAAANRAFLQDLSAALGADGFALGDCAPRYAPGRFVGLRQLAALMIAVLFPVLMFPAGGPRGAAFPVSAGAFSLAAALLVAAALSTPDFLLGMELFRGVKAALFLPLLLVAAKLYSKEELGAFLKRPLTVGSALALLLLAAAAVVYLSRSGNEAHIRATGLELNLRDRLESFFTVRPRFKEFALGHPLLWLAAYARKERRLDWRPLALAGMIAPLSIINTFCHAHVPLSVSLLRTFHGFWLGMLFGGGLILAYRSRGFSARAVRSGG